MGLPIDKLICASNKNNILTDFINTGVYDKNRDFNLTISLSMDILISSNLERFLYEISGKDDKLITEYMDKLSKEGKYEIENSLKEIVKKNFYGGFCDDEKTLETIKNTFENNNYLIDTHTAVAKAVYDEYVRKTNDNKVTVIASTASPYKFLNSVLSAINPDCESKEDDFSMLEELSKCSETSIPKSLKELKDKNIKFKNICEKDMMKKSVSDYLNF